MLPVSKGQLKELHADLLGMLNPQASLGDLEQRQSKVAFVIQYLRNIFVLFCFA